MDASYIMPFIESTKNVFRTMLQLEVTCGKPVVEAAMPSVVFDVSGIIGMSGDVQGSVILGFSLDTAEKVVAKFVGMPVAPDTDDFGDAVGEVLNMISGGAKAKFDGKMVSISCPSVVVGKEHKVRQMSDATCVKIPCNSECGEFSVEVSIKESPVQAASGGGAAASVSA